MSAELIDSLWRLSVVLTASLLVVLALRRLWRRSFGARATVPLWVLVPLSLLTAILPAPVEWIAVSSSDAMEVATPLSMSPAAAVATPESTLSADEVLAALWLSGAMLLGFALWQQQHRFLRSLGALRHWRDNIYFSSSPGHGPALIGLWRARIVLPSDFSSRYSERQQALVLAHEHAHLRRADLWVTLLACVIRVVFWFHPLAHLGSRCLRLDQELACDEAVIDLSPQTRRDYASAILNTQLTDLGLPVGCFWQSSQPVKTRIFMISNSTARRLPRQLGYALGLGLAALGLPLAWASQPAQLRIVSLDSPPPAAQVLSSPTAARGVPPIAAAPMRGPIAPSQVSRRELSIPASTLSLDAAVAVDDAKLRLALAQQPTDEASPASVVVTDWVPPKRVKAQRPKWPSSRWAHPQMTDGAEVLVSAMIDTDGRPTDVKIVSSSDKRFNPYARWALEKFRYEPARLSGKAVSSRVEELFVFDPRDRVVYEIIDPVGPPKIRYPQKELY